MKPNLRFKLGKYYSNEDITTNYASLYIPIQRQGVDDVRFLVFKKIEGRWRLNSIEFKWIPLQYIKHWKRLKLTRDTLNTIEFGIWSLHTRDYYHKKLTLLQDKFERIENYTLKPDVEDIKPKVVIPQAKDFLHKGVNSYFNSKNEDYLGRIIAFTKRRPDKNSGYPYIVHVEKEFKSGKRICTDYLPDYIRIQPNDEFPIKLEFPKGLKSVCVEATHEFDDPIKNPTRN